MSSITSEYIDYLSLRYIFVYLLGARHRRCSPIVISPTKNNRHMGLNTFYMFERRLSVALCIKDNSNS